jgi:hypothetical protein
MAPRGRLAVFDATRSVAGEDAMHPLMRPETFAPLAAAFTPCFSAPTYRVFLFLVAGWAQCVGRHTVTAVALAADAVGRSGPGWHVSMFHRFFRHSAWRLDDVGLTVFRLALRWPAPDEALVVLVDDTRARSPCGRGRWERGAICYGRRSSRAGASRLARGGGTTRVCWLSRT